MDEQDQISENEDRKRKRDSFTAPELTVDLDSEAPPSKKAIRKAKKAKLQAQGTTTDNDEPLEPTNGHAQATGANKTSNKKRSEHGVWIGNLPWTADEASIRQFLVEDASIEAGDITRLHLPEPKDKFKNSNTKPAKNKGFCYVDFSSAETVTLAIAASEKPLDGRKLLIKNAKSYEGRPDPQSTERSQANGGGPQRKPPSRRVFVGNLGFQTTEADIQRLFQKCGAIEEVFMATFQDTGKCKGYAWVTFVEIDAAMDAVKGHTFITVDESSDEDEPADEPEAEREPAHEVATTTPENTDAAAKATKQPAKKKRWFVNKLFGRDVRCEFAEDAQTRYKKRFGKESTVTAESDKLQKQDAKEPTQQKPSKASTKRARMPELSELSTAKSRGAIPASEGSKITFD